MTRSDSPLLAPCSTMSAKKRKVRTDFRKNREVRARDKDYQPRAGRRRFARRRPARRARQRQGRHLPQADRGRREIVEDDAGTHVLPRRRPHGLPPGPRAARARLAQHRARRGGRDLPMCDAAAAENAGHRSAARRGGGRRRLVSPRGQRRGDHRARRAAARRGEPHQPRPAARARGQCRPARHRHQRRRAAAQAESHRSLPGHGREGRHPADHLHQQDRPDRAGRPDAAGGRVRPARLRSAVGIGRRRASASTGCARGWPARKASSPAKAASASRRS